MGILLRVATQMLNFVSRSILYRNYLTEQPIIDLLLCKCNRIVYRLEMAEKLPEVCVAFWLLLSSAEKA